MSYKKRLKDDIKKEKIILEDEGGQEEDGDEIVWDFKKILVGFVVLTIVGFYLYLNPPKFNVNTNVLGALTKEVEHISPEEQKKIQQSQKEATEILDSAKDSLSQISSDNFEAQTDQIEKIINDLKALQSKSKEPLDIFCERVCKEK